MRKNLFTTFISIVVSLTVVIGFYLYFPLSWLDFISNLLSSNKLGSTIIILQSTDTLKDSRAYLNTSINNLNITKLENATTTASLNIGLLTVGSLLATTSTATSSFAGGAYASLLASPYFHATSTTATSTFANGIRLTGGCIFMTNDNLCLTNNVSSVSNSNGSLTISPTTGSVVASLNLGKDNVWTSSQTFSSGFNISTTTYASSTPMIFNGSGQAKYFGFPTSASGNYSIAPDGTTGNVSITHNLGRIPYRINITATSYADGTFQGNGWAGVGTSFGTATSTTSQYASYSNFLIGETASNIFTRSIASTSPINITMIPDGSGGNDWVMRLTAIDSTTFTLNVLTNETESGDGAPQARTFIWEAF